MNPTLSNEELIEIAEKGYCDGQKMDFPPEFPKTIEEASQHKCGDTLADFVIIELIEGTDGEEDHGEERLNHAMLLMERAKDQLDGVIGALSDARDERYGWFEPNPNGGVATHTFPTK